MTRHHALLAAGLTLAGAAFPPTSDARIFYRFKALTGIAGARSSTGIAINDSNIATGSVTLPSPASTQAYKTDPDGNMVALGVPEGMHRSYGQAINEAGQIAGFAERNGSNQTAFVTDVNGSLLNLGSLDGTKITPLSINDAGQVTGSASTANSGSNVFAFLGKFNTPMVNLGTINGASKSIGAAINDAGIIVGAIVTTTSKAFITDANGLNMRELLPDQPYSAAMAINAGGQVAGYYRASQYGKVNAFVTDGNGLNLHALEGLGGLESYATGINDAGKFVGHYYENHNVIKGFIADATGHAKPLTKLMTTPLPDACNPFIPYDINNNDWIVGTCGPNDKNYAFLLIPEEVANVTPSRENSFKLSETQQDLLNCDADKKCSLATAATGTQQLSIKLSAATLNSHGIDLKQLQPATPMAISIGNYSFSGSLENADPDKHQLRPSHLPATWTSKHNECKKYAPDNSCSRNVTVVDSIIKISADKKYNLSISIKGKKSFGNASKFGQPIVADLCPSSPVGSSQIIDSALLSIDSQPLPMTIKIDCKLKSTTKTIRQSQTSFTLNSLSLKAGLINDP